MPSTYFLCDRLKHFPHYEKKNASYFISFNTAIITALLLRYYSSIKH